MKPTEQFTLLPISGLHPPGEGRRHLLRNGKVLPDVVNGDEICAQFVCGALFIVVTAYDYFDGASTWFYLIDAHGKIIDAVATPDYFGFINDIDLTDASCIKFGFFGTNDRWSLHVSASGFWSFILTELMRRPNRFLFSRRFLSLTCTKGAPWTWPPA